MLLFLHGEQEEHYTPCQQNQLAFWMQLWNLPFIFSIIILKAFSTAFRPSQGSSSSAHLDQYFVSSPWKMHLCCRSMKIMMRNLEQQELGEYPRLSWDIAGLGKGEADVDPTELNFAPILSVKYPPVKETEMEKKGTTGSDLWREYVRRLWVKPSILGFSLVLTAKSHPPPFL